MRIIASCCAIGLSSVEATKVFRICAVRAMRSALLALLPRLAGLCRFDELFAMVFEVFDFEAEVAPEVDFDFVLPAVPVLPLEDFFFAEAERVAEDF